MKKKLIKEEGGKKVFLCKEWETEAGLPAIILRFEHTKEFLEQLPETLRDSMYLHDWWTGYVRNEGEEIDTVKIEVHGGVTFEGGCPLGKTEGEWVGFDLNHVFDTGKEPISYVVQECEKLAKQIKTGTKELNE